MGWGGGGQRSAGEGGTRFAKINKPRSTDLGSRMGGKTHTYKLERKKSRAITPAVGVPHDGGALASLSDGSSPPTNPFFLEARVRRGPPLLANASASEGVRATPVRPARAMAAKGLVVAGMKPGADRPLPGAGAWAGFCNRRRRQEGWGGRVCIEIGHKHETTLEVCSAGSRQQL